MVRAPESVGSNAGQVGVKSSRVYSTTDALDRHCSGQEKCLAEGRQLQRDGWPGSVGVQLARWCGWWRGEQGQQQRTEQQQQQQRGSPWSVVVEPWLVAHARAVGCGGGGPLAGSADGTAEGRNLASRAAAAAEMEEMDEVTQWWWWKQCRQQ